MPASPPDYERFVRLLMAAEPRLRGFLRSLLPSWEDVDDVVQETSLVAWRKFTDFDGTGDFASWIITIGRFEALKQRRSKARDRLVFSETLLATLADEGEAEVAERERRHGALRRCLDKLDERQAEWLELAYQPGMKFHEAAERCGKSSAAFYKLLQRLRAGLEDCVTRELGELGRP